MARRLSGISLVMSLVLASGCASSGGGSAARPGGSGGMSAEEIEAVYRERIEASRMRFTPADVRFMTSMIHHHAQAIEMAELVPERTENPQIRTLAARIINAQHDEIATMRRWLSVRGQPLPPTVEEMGAHAAMGHGPAHGMAMPGMVSPEGMEALRNARGPEFDRLFLTSMISHHQGAVTMVKELFATDGAAQDDEVFKFASDAQVDQATEVARMQLMLTAMQ